MSGRIKDTDVALVRDRTPIDQLVSTHVTLTNAGAGRLKGLCPFHEEKSPSFTVNPAQGFFYCFGCGEGGDAISFIRKIEHLEFTEAVERLAERAGIQLSYEGAGPSVVRDRGRRQRLVAAHRLAAEFYQQALYQPAAVHARQFLDSRGFNASVAGEFECGYSPDQWDSLSQHLRKQGFSDSELVTAGLCKAARSGSIIDRFRNRVMWPVRDISGDVVGFGARRLTDSNDDGPKYLNSPETPIYKKSHLLYGADRARKAIAAQRQVVIVEGYTDVMACHLAGITTAVATCGTAFGEDHIGVIRRLMLDSQDMAGEVIFTFDGDAAGHKAAMRAFEGDQKFISNTLVAIEPSGMDPCELRLTHGDAALRDLIARRQHLVAFVVKNQLNDYDLTSVEGRTLALQRTGKIITSLKNENLRQGYARELAGWLGMEYDQVRRSLASAGRAQPQGPANRRSISAATDRQVDNQVEREAIKLAIQEPALAGPLFDAFTAADYNHPMYQNIREAISNLGGVAAATGIPRVQWVERIRETCSQPQAGQLVPALAVEALHNSGELDNRYVEAVISRLQEWAVGRRIERLRSSLQRMNPVTQQQEYYKLFEELVALERHKRDLQNREPA